jgi:4-aminobutyrate aminotransferase-like enzyme
MTVGKGIGGGMAVSAVVGRTAFMGHWRPGTHTSTFMGNAVNLAAGRAAIDVFRDERLAERSATVGSRLLERLRADLADQPHVGEIRGLGLFAGIEIVADPESRDADPARTAAIRRTTFGRGVLVGAGGHLENVLKLCPPLTIDEPVLEMALDPFIDAIKESR